LLPKFIVVLRCNLRDRRSLQLGLLTMFWLAGEAVVRCLKLPVPGGIMAMFIVLALLATGQVNPAYVRHGAHWFIAEMPLFFVPMVLAILDHKEFLGLLGLKIVGVIVGGTLIIMVVTALATDLCFRLMVVVESNRVRD